MQNKRFIEKCIRDNSNKKTPKIIALLIIISLIIYSTNLMIQQTIVPEHRLQLWLDDISWNENRGINNGHSVVVAIIDTKINLEHPDLESRYIECYSLLDNSVISDGNKVLCNINHGTAIAGIIAAYPSSENGVMGIAPATTLISIEIAQSNTEKISVVCLKKAIDLAVDLNADIINISCGTLKNDSNLYHSIKRAYNDGIIIVASAGNGMKDNLLYPAAYKEVIAVGSLSKGGEIISPIGKLEKEVVFLPGENIVTTDSKNDYCSISGTSASAAIMTGIVALMKQKSPNINADEIVRIMNNSKEINLQEILSNV